MSPCQHIRTGFIALAYCFRVLMYLNYMRMLSDLHATLFKICTHDELIFLPIITIAITRHHHHHHHIQLLHHNEPPFSSDPYIPTLLQHIRGSPAPARLRRIKPPSRYVRTFLQNNVDVDSSDDDPCRSCSRSSPSLLRLSFEIDSNEVMDEYFPALCTPQALMPLLRDSPQETLLDPGIYGPFSFSRLPHRCCVRSCTQAQRTQCPFRLRRS